MGIFAFGAPYIVQYVWLCSLLFLLNEKTEASAAILQSHILQTDVRVLSIDPATAATD